MKTLTRENSIAKGYRLQPKTHKLINVLSKRTKSNIDNVLWLACKDFRKKMQTAK
ncbi:MAG TPA: hypothetical protein PKA39_00150 [Ignavibacteria bacterium]|jgi:hypothetical protein|nr:hypothetical protein [Ignavibacteria bacterium]